MSTFRAQRSPIAGGGRRSIRPALTLHRPILRHWLTVTVFGLFFGACGYSVLKIIRAESSVTATVLGMLLSLVVLGIIVPILLWLDRFERGPPALLAFTFAWGGCVATLGALTLNQIGGALIGAKPGDRLIEILVAPVVEESLKGLAPLLLLLIRRRQIDGIVDGMVYAGLSAAGFAAVEDVFYLAQGYSTSGEHGLFATFLVRVIMSPFAHPLFSICFGIGIGLSATSARWSVRIGAPILGWGVAVGLHAAWNAAAVLATAGSLWTYLVFQLPLFAVFIALVVSARRREARLIDLHLRHYVDTGDLTSPEVEMLASIPERRYARAWATSHFGTLGEHQMQQLQDAGSDLALLRARIVHGQRDPRLQRDERELLTVIATCRAPYLDTALYRRG